MQKYIKKNKSNCNNTCIKTVKVVIRQSKEFKCVRVKINHDSIGIKVVKIIIGIQ